jgi:hypothetical protein
VSERERKRIIAASESNYSSSFYFHFLFNA